MQRGVHKAQDPPWGSKRPGGLNLSKSLSLFLTLALATLPLAGCLGGKESTPPVPAQEDEVGAAGANATDGDADSSATSGAAPGANATGGPAASREIPIALDGKVPTFVAACAFAAVAGQCVETPAQWDSEVEIAQSGTGESLVLTLTWTAASPLTETLSVYMMSHNEDWSEAVHHAFAEGASPLTLELAGPFDLPEGMTHEIGVGVPFHGTPGGAPVFAGAALAVEQAFTLEGVLVLSG